MNANAIIISLVVALWGATVIFVAWDANRRGLAGYQQFIWVILALLPLIGFVAYLMAGPFLPDESGNLAEAKGQSPKRITFLKPGAAKRLPTIPVAEYLRAAQLDPQRAAQESGQSRTSAGSYVLSVLEGPHSGEEFVINRLPAYIGRGPGCDIRLDNDLGVSRRHAQLYLQADKLCLRDLDSTHGTTVNGHDIDDQGLTSGDKIRLGYSLLIVKIER